MQDVKVYSTETCSYCVKAKDLLTKNGIRYTEIPATRETLIEVSGQLKVPVIVADGKVILGFGELSKILPA